MSFHFNLTTLLGSGFRALGISYFILFLVGCTNPLGGKSSVSSGFLAGLLPSNLPSISVAHSSVTLTNTTAYSVSGGKSPYTVTTTGGTISSATGSGTLDPTGASGSIVLQVTDSAGSTAQTTVNIVSGVGLGIGGALPSTLTRHVQTLVTISGKVYLFGGISNGSQQSDTWMLDLSVGATGVWKQLSPSGTIPPARFFHSAVVIANKMYIFGGCGNAGCPSSDLWVYDPSVGSDGTWTQLSPSGSAPGKYDHTAVVIANKMYVFGGDTAGIGLANDTWVFDPSAGSNGSWTQLSPSGTPPSVRDGHIATSISSKMYVFGGLTNSGATNDLWVFDTSAGANGSWTQLSPTGTNPSPRYSGTTNLASGKMYMFGGSTSSGPINETWAFDPSAGANGSWTQLSPSGTSPSPRYQFAGTVVSNKIYVYGGESNSGALNDMFAFDPSVGSSGNWAPNIPVYLQSSALLAASDTDVYIVTGGVPPYTMSALVGSVSNSSGSGNYTASSSVGSDTLTVTDSLGNTATVSISTNPALSVTSNFSILGTYSTATYTVSGGVPPYSVSTDNGTIDTPTGSGIYATNGGSGTATITAVDSLGNSANTVITIATSDVGIDFSQAWVDQGGSVYYSISGGDGNYSIAADTGTVVDSGGAGYYYANGNTGNANITVTDEGATTNVVLVVYAPLSLTVGNYYPYFGDSTTYTVSGGSGNYSVSTYYGSSIDNGSGSGNFTANGYYNNDYIYLQDNVTGENTVVQLNFSYYPLSITVDNSNLNYNDSTNYYVNGGSGNFYISTSNGGGYSNSYGSGTYYAYPCCGYNYDYINVYDYNSGQSASVYVSVTLQPLSISVSNSSVNYNDEIQYYVSGGSGYYNVYTDYGGYVDNSGGSGDYYADPCCGYSQDEIEVYDYNTGQYANVYISISYPPLSLFVNNTTMNVGDTTAYNVSGGSGNYSVNVDYGAVDNGSGSGNFTATGGGYVNITVYDYNFGNSVSQQIVVYGNLLINVNPEATAPLGSAAYSAFNQNSSSYSWSLDSNSVSAGATIDSVTGPNGNFTAPSTPIVADLTLTDDLGNSGTYPINVTSPGNWTESPGFAGRYLSPAVTIANKMYIFGGDSNGALNDTWVFDPSTGASGTWTQLSPTGTTPPARLAHATTVISNKMYVFGGNAAGIGYANDLWVFDPSTSANGSWAKVTPSGTAPPARMYSTAVTISNKMYIFGGYNSGEYNDTWVFDPSAGANGSWTQLSPSGSVPSARYGHMATMMSNKMYVFGGWTGGYASDTWVFDPSSGANGSWTQLSPSGSPSGRYLGSAVAISTKMYIFSGMANGGYQHDVWVFDSTAGANGSWTQFSPSGTIPSNRMSPSVAAISGNVYFFSGYSSGYNIETWLFNPSSSGSWTQLAPAGSGPSARYFHTAVTISNKMYVFAGYSNGYNSDLWTFDPSIGVNGTWTQLSPSGTLPAGRYGQLATVISNKMYMFGGCTTIGCSSTETWVYDPSTGASGTWTQLSPSNPPSGRYYSSAVTISNKMYIFGGCGNAGCPTSDTWVFDPSTGANGSWTQLSPSGTIPPGRYFYTAVAIANKMYMFGGAGSPDNSTWVFDPSAGANGSWTQLSPLNPPGNRYGNAAVAISNKMYIFGGAGANDSTVFSFNPSAGSQGTWLAEPSTGTIPSVQYFGSSAVVSGKMVIFGGNNPYTNNTYIYQPSP
jgi:hypothetical protein